MEPKQDDLKSNIRTIISKTQSFNSFSYSTEKSTNHQEVVGALKSFEMAEIVKLVKQEMMAIEFEKDGKAIIEKGSPHIRLFKCLADNNSTLSKKKLIEILTKEVYDRGFSMAMRQKLLTYNKENDEVTLNSAAKYDVDEIQNDLIRFSKDTSPKKEDEKKLKDYKKDKLLKEVKIIYWIATPGVNFEETRKSETDLTTELLHNDQWEKFNFKPYNYNAKGKEQNLGGLHPLLKVRSQYRQMLLELGFQEMPTNCFVESSFWNFDSLFQPQLHPARDAHDTFFLTNPKYSDVENTEYKDYFFRVKEVHEKGGYGSKGWDYKWSHEEAHKNLLRTHTTAVSSKMLYKLAQDYKKTGVFKPTKLFSIDRVFRNESLDKTHLAEFHQIEGVIADKNIGLGHLMGTIEDFFIRMGIKKLEFKPTFNPYTEPSMEVYSTHDKLGRVEIGNSGVFRPEMLLPMGLPEDVQVIAWGLSLERPTMINYGIDNIRELFGHDVKISDTRKSSMYCLLNKNE